MARVVDTDVTSCPPESNDTVVQSLYRFLDALVQYDMIDRETFDPFVYILVVPPMEFGAADTVLVVVVVVVVVTVVLVSYCAPWIVFWLASVVVDGR
jgi:hypothetical protein